MGKQRAIECRATSGVAESMEVGWHKIINHIGGIMDSSSGAKFLRADMHIHSFGAEGSFDVTDETMTPENIVDTAIGKQLQIIAITDHNEIGNSKKAIDYAREKGLYVIPGIEVSTTQGHLLVYFPEYTDLKSFYSKLNISPEKDRCTQGIVDCLNFADTFGGIGVLAHIGLTSGFEETIGRFGPQMEDVVTHKNVVGMEISNKSEIDCYTDKDDNPERRRLFNLRKERLQLPTDYDFPKLMSSDSHTLDRLGTNADKQNKLTRIKTDDLNFQAFKNALVCQKSRIRLEELIPEKINRFVSIQIEGGLLDKQVVNFSNNLTCIIGGRGAGKSTLLEAVRETSGNSSGSKVVDSEVWPEKITLIYEDDAGQTICLSREKNSNVTNVKDPANGINKIDIESYGQGATAETIQHSDSNPKILVDLLDSFIDVHALMVEETEVRGLLIENQSLQAALRIEVAAIPETERLKLNLEGKLEQLKKDNVGDLVTYQTALLKEREIRSGIVKELKDLITNYRELLADKTVFEAFGEFTDEEIIIGKDNFARVKEIVSEFSVIVGEKASELNISLNEKISELSAQIKDWSEKEKNIQTTIDEKKKELEAKGIPFDIGKINQIAKDVIYHTDRLKKLKAKRIELGGLQKTRLEQIKRRNEIKNRIFYQRHSFAASVNENLKNAVDGFFVNIKYEQGKYSDQFEEAIKTAMEWRTSQVPKSKILARSISPVDFVNGIKKKNLDLLKEIKDSEGARIFTDSEITRIIARVFEHHAYEDFETLIYDDLPRISVTKTVVDDTGKTVNITRSLSQLSLGQQQSILLAILLQSKSTTPLIIDQPEDNLDSEFIYKTIVANLRRIKENRQVIIVTHNPNIAILGDAELIIPLKSTSLKSHIRERGSIDRPATRDLCCDILEGGKIAFVRRKEIYGI